MKINERGFRRLLLATTLAVGATASIHGAQAGLALTSAGIAAGLTLSTFVSGFSDSGGDGTGVGPTAVGFSGDGGVIVTSYNDNGVIKFASDTDGQTVSLNGTLSTGFSQPVGATTVAGTVYVGNQGSGTIVALNNDGSINHAVVSGMGGVLGLVTNPANGHIFASVNGTRIIDMNPADGSYTTFKSGISVDGMSISPDGSTLFAESGDHVYGFSVATGLQTFDSGFISTADGAAAAGGTLAGNVFINTNDGNLYEVNETTDAQTLIASGGSRGDLVSVDPNGSLLLSQSNSVVRLTLPSGASFTDAPEPASLALLGVGTAAIGALRRRKAKSSV